MVSPTPEYRICFDVLSPLYKYYIYDIGNLDNLHTIYNSQKYYETNTV